MIAAAVVTYNRAKLLEECLSSLVAQEPSGVRKIDRVFVIDNASTDDTPNVIARLVAEHPGRIECQRNATNEGGSAGFHAAIKLAYESGAEWIWVMDDDAIPEKGALRALLGSSAASAADTGGLGCLVMDAANENLFLPNLQCRVNRETFDFSAVEWNSGAAEIAVDTNSFVGLLLHRRAIETLGLPDRDYFIWYDDIEYSLRVSARFKLWLVPASRIVHKAHPRDIEQKHWLFNAKVPVYPWEDCWRMYYGSRNRYIVSRGYSSGLKFHVNFAKHLLKELLVPGLFAQDHLKERWALSLKAAIDGYRGRKGKTIEIRPPFTRSSNG